MATYWTLSRHLLCTKKAGAYMNNTYSMCQQRQLSIKSNRDEAIKETTRPWHWCLTSFPRNCFVVVVFFKNWHMELRGWQSNPAGCFPSFKKKAKTCLTYFLISSVLLLYLLLFALGHTNTYVTAYEDNLNKSNSELISKYKIHLHFSH